MELLKLVADCRVVQKGTVTEIAFAGARNNLKHQEKQDSLKL